MEQKSANVEKETIRVVPKEGAALEISVRNHRLIVDQPAEKGGKNEGMTPVELFLGSLASCVGYYAVRFCQRHNLPAEGLRVSMEWEYAKEPYRVSVMELHVDLPVRWNPEYNERFLKVIEGCTVHQSISQTPKILLHLN
jgi:uncharacterized OsmC-like protein